MKIITIGRNPDCNIVLDDNMISRRHALIKIYATGKYELVSSGGNGTNVNGNLVTPNQPYPLKRGDSVTFAHKANLDWSLVPDPLKPFRIGAVIVGCIVFLAVVCLVVVKLLPEKQEDLEEITVDAIDSPKQDDTVSHEEKVIQDEQTAKPGWMEMIERKKKEEEAKKKVQPKQKKQEKHEKSKSKDTNSSRPEKPKEDKPKTVEDQHEDQQFPTYL